MKKIGKLVGPNARIKVTLRDGFAIEIRVMGLRFYIPFVETGDYEVDVKDLGRPIPHEAFPIDFFEVDAKQALMNVCVWRTSKACMSDAFNALCTGFPDISFEDVCGAFREHVGAMLMDNPNEDPEFQQMLPDAVDFVITNSIYNERRKLRGELAGEA